MNLYLISQDSNRDYDTYDSAVVAAVNEKDASVMHPYGRKKDRLDRTKEVHSFEWVLDPSLVKVEYIGVAKDKQQRAVICASFNAG